VSRFFFFPPARRPAGRPHCSVGGALHSKYLALLNSLIFTHFSLACGKSLLAFERGVFSPEAIFIPGINEYCHGRAIQSTDSGKIIASVAPEMQNEGFVRVISTPHPILGIPARDRSFQRELHSLISASCLIPVS